MLDVDSVLIENVPEYEQWGPLDENNFPIKERKGETFKAWTAAIKSLNYNIEWHVLNAADYGAATSRRRLFIVAKKGKQKIKWPEPTHSKEGVGLHKWRAAREIIDWENKGKSIFNRKRPLSPNTIKRIIAGLKKFGTEELEPFIIAMEHGGSLDDIGNPLRTITTAKGGAMALVQPFVLSQASGGAPRSTNDPLPTIPAGGAHALIKPFIVEYHGKTTENEKERISSIEDTLHTIDTSNRYAVAEPKFILPPEGFFRQNTPKSLEQTLGTITQRGGGHLVECHIIQQNHNSIGTKIDNPLPSMTTNNK